MNTVGFFRFAAPVTKSCAVVVLFFLSLPGSAVAGQGDEPLAEISEQTETAAEALDERRWFFMPVPISNPTIGTGLGVMAMHIFQAGENAPASNLMVGGLWADSDSWAGGFGGETHFKNDNYRLSGWGGYFDVNLKFYGIGSGAGDRGEYIEINQLGPFFMPRLLRRVAGRFYLGAQLRYLTVTTAFSNLPDWLPGDILRDGLKTRSSGLGLVAEYDGRDNQFNASSGSYLLFTSNFAREDLGSDRDYEQYELGFNTYFDLGKTMVLAWRATGCAASGDAPFYDVCLFGSQSDGIRGYVGGQYRDDVSLTTQLEYRWRFYKKWGMVAFAGMGQVAPAFDEMTLGNILPSYGIGVRFMASEEQRINLSIDYARGKDSDAWYFNIGESF